MSTIGDTDGTKAALRAAPIEAERECQQSRADDYVARIIRDTRIVRAHCGGESRKEISVVGLPLPVPSRYARNVSARIVHRQRGSARRHQRGRRLRLR